MQGDKKNHGKYQDHYAKRNKNRQSVCQYLKRIWQMKHKKQHYIKILNQDINEHDQHANVPSENSGTLNV